MQSNKKRVQVCIYQAEIPHNTGAAIRLCSGYNASLHLIRPLGFVLSDKQLQRVALGYHQAMRPETHKNLSAYLSSLNAETKLFYFSSRAEDFLHEQDFSGELALLFGAETHGLPMDDPELAARGRAVKIPQTDEFRCHNLSNSIAMALYEVARQDAFSGLK